MKYDIQKAFPYPVLSDNKDYSDDYPARDFQARVDLRNNEKEDYATLTASFRVSEESVLNRIKEKTATYGVHVLCPKTKFRSLIPSSGEKLEHAFNSGELYDKVVLMGCVVCTNPIEGHWSANFHKELSEQKYDFPLGGILAIAEPEIYYVSSSPNRPLISVFDLTSDDSVKDGEFRYFLEGETILIKMDKKHYTRFNLGRQNSQIRNFLVMSVYYPVLVEVLRAMAGDEGGEYESKKWYHAINRQLTERGIDISDAKDENIFLYAQQLMQYPLSKLPLEDNGND